VEIGGLGSGGGNGGIIDLRNGATILTLGNNSSGIFAQSIGGGGGFGAGSSASTGANLGNGGNGGDVTIANTNAIQTVGANSHGIFAQSIGGGGGAVSSISNSTSFLVFAGSTGAAGTGGDVKITQTGDIFTPGANSFGILAQSQGTTGNGNITIDFLSGSITGGSGNGAGVGFLNGNNNLLTNRGMISSGNGLGGWAISGTSGNETVDNFGTVIGSFNLGNGVNVFNNRFGATFISGSIANLGSGTGNNLFNSGLISPGGLGNILTTGITGNFNQTSSGIYQVDLDVSTKTGAADRINVTGTANLAGTIQLNVLNTSFMMPGRRTAILVSAAGTVLDHTGLTLIAPISAVGHFVLKYPNETDVLLDYAGNFAIATHKPNQQAVGNFFNDVQLNGGSQSFSPLIKTLFEIPDAATLGDIYDHLSPEPYLSLGVGTFLSNMKFNESMLNCRDNVSDNYNSELRPVRNGQCRWLRFSRRDQTKQERTGSNLGFTEKGMTLSGGFERAITRNLRGGFGFGYSETGNTVNDFAEMKGQLIQVGGSLAARFGDTAVSASVSIGHGKYDSSRFVSLPDYDGTARSQQGLYFGSGYLRVARTFEFNNFYMKPGIVAGVSHVRMNGFNESGADILNLRVRQSKTTFVTLEPELEFGKEIRYGETGSSRLFVKTGVTNLIRGRNQALSASFQGAPDGIAPFTVFNSLDKNIGKISMGLEINNQSRFGIRFGYYQQFSGRFTSRSSGLTILF
jgi:Autotransporter beta-domain